MRESRIHCRLVLALVATGCTTGFDRSLIGGDGGTDDPGGPTDGGNTDGGVFECPGCEADIISAAGSTTCFRRRDSTLWCWGSNDSGQLGSPDAGEFSQKPISIDGQWNSVAVAGDADVHVCATDSGDGLDCWGANGDRESNGGSSETVTTPTLVQPGSDKEFASVSIGLAYSCALADNGTVFCWGWSGGGRLGFEPEGSFALKPDPVPIVDPVDGIDAGDDHACAIAVGGQLYCWGENFDGQRGHDGAQQPPQEVQPGEIYLAISAGGNHTCGIRADRSLWCWGRNDEGQLGVDGAPGGVDPVRVPGNGWRSVSAGELHTCSTNARGELYCWGSGARGMLGLGNEDDQSSPQRVGGREDWFTVTAGVQHTCGITADQTVWCWGSGESGGTSQPGQVNVPSPVSFVSD